MPRLASLRGQKNKLNDVNRFYSHNRHNISVHVVVYRLGVHLLYRSGVKPRCTLFSKRRPSVFRLSVCNVRAPYSGD